MTPAATKVDLYQSLNGVVHALNERLFDGQLAPCVITLRARGLCSAMFMPFAIQHADGSKSHEIAINPRAFDSMTIEQCLSSLAHEMVHQAQFEFGGSAYRRTYHNKDFANRMESLGLRASSTGAPGGGAVGEAMSQYIVEGGRFSVVVSELLDAGLRARWPKQFASHPVLETNQAFDSERQKRGTGLGAKRKAALKAKVKFSCLSCAQALWGKESLNVICGNCLKPMSVI